jgi:hypothetical protein
LALSEDQRPVGREQAGTGECVRAGAWKRRRLTIALGLVGVVSLVEDGVRRAS